MQVLITARHVYDFHNLQLNDPSSCCRVVTRFFFGTNFKFILEMIPSEMLSSLRKKMLKFYHVDIHFLGFAV